MRVADMGRGRERLCACALACLGLGASACLIADNPRFVSTDAAADGASGGSEGGDSTGAGTGEGESDPSGDSSDDCPPGMLDCDDDGECEAEDDALSSCGACGHVCEYPDAVELACDQGVCVGFVDVPAVQDVTLVTDEASEPAGRVRIYADGSDPRREALLRFATLAFDDGVELVGAQLLLFSHQTTPPIGAHIVTEPWEDQTATWPGPSFEMMPAQMLMPSGGMIAVPFDEALDWWGGAENFGLRLRNMDDSEAEFDSVEGAEPPRLRIELRF